MLLNIKIIVDEDIRAQLPGMKGAGILVLEPENIPSLVENLSTGDDVIVITSAAVFEALRGSMAGADVRSLCLVQRDAQVLAAGSSGLYRQRLGEPTPEALAAAIDRCLTFCLEKTIGASFPQTVFSGTRNVTLIGAGIVNLMTALTLAEAGYRVTIYDRSPAPGKDGSWNAMGCTHGGGNARMFTYTEMDVYNVKHPSAARPAYFDRDVSEKGWNCLTAINPSERDWIANFHSLPRTIAGIFNDDIIQLSTQAAQLWQSLHARHPFLPETANFREGILRLYDDAGLLQANAARHAGIGSLIRRLDRADIEADFPALRHQRMGMVGGLLTKGFTVNIHDYARTLISVLDSRWAVEFHWNCEVAVRRQKGEISEILVDGVAIGGDSFVFSPGAYGTALSGQSPIENVVHGMLGGWLTIPNAPVELTHSLKVARRNHVTEDANVTLEIGRDGEKNLVIGSGYGYVGLNRDPIPQKQLQAMYHGIVDTARKLFPDNCEDRDFELDWESSDAFRYCIRPWTARSLGIFHIERLQNGGRAIFTNGHNTGGFAQSPIVAEAVRGALRGEIHPMHYLYHPQRSEIFAD